MHGSGTRDPLTEFRDNRMRIRLSAHQSTAMHPIVRNLTAKRDDLRKHADASDASGFPRTLYTHA